MSGGASLSEQLEVLLISSNDWFQAFIAAQRDTFVADLQSLGFQEPPFAAQRHGPSTRNQRRARNRLLVIGWVFGAGASLFSQWLCFFNMFLLSCLFNCILHIQIIRE